MNQNNLYNPNENDDNNNNFDFDQDYREDLMQLGSIDDNNSNSPQNMDQSGNNYDEHDQDSSTTTATTNQKRLLVLGVDGGTESIRACCFDAVTGQVVGQACAVSYPTSHPHPGWAEQNPHDWYRCLQQACQQTLESLYFPTLYRVGAICLDTTCCSVVALDAQHEPLRPCLLWMDQRSAPQTRQVVATQDSALLAVNGPVRGKVTSLSAEWLTPKALWIFQNEHQTTYQKARVICEYQDYLNFKLTGVLTSSACNAATRWHWDAKAAVEVEPFSEPKSGVRHYPGRPMSLYQSVGLSDLAQKLPQTCRNMGEVVGYLTPQAARDLSGKSSKSKNKGGGGGLELDTALPVIQGGPDAFVGMVGLGCVGQQQDEGQSQLCLITGSSHLHCLVLPLTTGNDGDDQTKTPNKSSGGMWGPYLNAPLPGLAFGEGGQSSTGSLLKWAKHEIFDDAMSYKEMDELASEIPIGSDGLLALETFQGSRTPVTDPLARGAMIGLTLSHTKAHIWRALMEAVCFGTRACLDALERSTGHPCETITLAGGIARSPLWLQMHADVTNKPIKVYGPDHNAPLLGCAILASVGIGIHPNVETAVRAMLPEPEIVYPNPQAVHDYNRIYQRVYSKLSSKIRPLVHSIHSIRNGHDEPTEEAFEDDEYVGMSVSNDRLPLSETTISPSLLACDFGSIRREVKRCMDAGATRFHVDVFDGVATNSPIAFTFGPDMVRMIAKAAKKHAFDNGLESPSLDLHMCVLDPARFVEPMAIVGATSFIFQWEAMYHAPPFARKKRALALAKSITDHKMKCGVSVNPETAIWRIKPLLASGLVSVVDVLAVKPGFGGQSFQSNVLKKILYLKEWRDRKGLTFDIMVDGGVTKETAKSVKEAGANVLVAGSFVFKHAQGIQAAMKELLI